MARRTDSKERFVRAAADLFQRQGYHGTGVNEIVAASGAPRGSLYFHFPGGKEELASAALQEAADAMAAATAEALAGADDPSGAVRQLAALTADALEHSSFARGCPLATVTLDVAHDSAPVRQAVAAGYRHWTAQIADRLVAFGLGRERAVERAGLVLAALQGGMILARAQHDTSVIRTIGDQLAEGLREDLKNAR
jgi:TetR/AcrR family transcriptional regulator, lmrAB and yxaGH operons repressor